MMPPIDILDVTMGRLAGLTLENPSYWQITIKSAVMTPPIDILDIASARAAAASERLQAARAMQGGPAANALLQRALVSYQIAEADMRIAHDLALWLSRDPQPVWEPDGTWPGSLTWEASGAVG